MSRENLPPSGTRPRGAPAGGVSISTSLSVIVAAIAVLLGFLILRDVNRERTGADFGTGVEVPNNESSSSEESTTTPTATPAPNRTGFQILVANASGVSGSAGQMTTALQAQQFVVTQPLNADPNLGKLTTTIVYYVPGF
ncbi:MAG: LytR C-terminal domain-containing protein, partial [Actinomycetota bacterium]